MNTPVIACNAVGENSSLVYTACAAGIHDFFVQWEQDGPRIALSLYLESGQVLDSPYLWYVYPTEGTRLLTYKITGIFQKAGTNSTISEMEKLRYRVTKTACELMLSQAPTISPAPTMPPVRVTSDAKWLLTCSSTTISTTLMVTAYLLSILFGGRK